MDLSTEILNSVTIAFSSIYALMCILWALVKTARTRLLPSIILLALFNIVLQVIGGKWLIAGLYVLVSSPFFYASFIYTYDDMEEDESDKVSEEIESDEDPKSEPIILQITAVAVDAPRVPTKNGTYPKCGGPLDFERHNCAFCGVPLVA